MSKPLSDFHDLLLPEVPGCTVPMLNLHLVHVARDFCQQTSAWRLPFDSVNLLAGQAIYDLEPSEPSSEVVRITSLTLGMELIWQSDEQPKCQDRANVDVAVPKYLRNSPPFTLSPDLLEITLLDSEAPTADLIGGLQVIGAMKPSFKATVLPDFLLSQYSEALRFGALSRLMVMTKKPWTDRALATAYMGEWHKALNFAAYQSQVGNTRAPLRVRKWG